MRTNANIDMLGDRLKKPTQSQEDVQMLDEYRSSFSAAYGEVFGFVRDKLGLSPTGRPAKTTTSIVNKLRRESIRLSQMQDISGCRVVVGDLGVQNKVKADLESRFPDSSIVDRRKVSSNGYRAVHFIARVGSKRVEVQIRTILQHLWAELSEKLADGVDPGIKYGRGDPNVHELLTRLSEELYHRDLEYYQYSEMFVKLEERAINVVHSSDTGQKPLTEGELAEALSIRQEITSGRLKLDKSHRKSIESLTSLLEQLRDLTEGTK